MNSLKCHTSFIQVLIVFQSITISNFLLLNKIIELGGDKFRYSRFSFYSNGDMIVDTSCYPITNNRSFYGLKKKR